MIDVFTKIVAADFQSLIRTSPLISRHWSRRCKNHIPDKLVFYILIVHQNRHSLLCIVLLEMVLVQSVLWWARKKYTLCNLIFYIWICHRLQHTRLHIYPGPLHSYRGKSFRKKTRIYRKPLIYALVQGRRRIHHHAEYVRGIITRCAILGVSWKEQIMIVTVVQKRYATRTTHHHFIGMLSKVQNSVFGSEIKVLDANAP